MCSCLVTVALLWQKLSQPKCYKDLTRKTAFFEDWSWFNFNNLALVLGTSLKFYTSMAKGLKLKVRKFLGLIPTFVEVTWGKLVKGALLPPPPSLPILNRVKKRYSKTMFGGFYYLQDVKPTFFILDTFRWCTFYPLDIYTTCVQNVLVRNDSDISQCTCNLYQLSVWRLYGAFERELVHPGISFCKINFYVYWFLGILRFIGKSAKIC